MSDLFELKQIRKDMAKKMSAILEKGFEKTSLAHEILYDYPSRPGKGIRPGLCIASCGAVDGEISNSFNTAAAIELLHNSFLIKDDIVDQSEYRRGKRTLNRIYGLELAINAGDALKVLSLSPLLDNTEMLGVRKSLQLLLEIQNMAYRSVEGQIIELNWVRRNETNLKFEDYYDMCTKKTCYYTCITPCRTGIIIGLEEASDSQLNTMTRFGRNLGIGFQIRDDALNLVSSFESYGKEIGGDILEGKRTLILIHLLNSVSSVEKRKIAKILKKHREKKTINETQYIRKMMDKYDSIEASMKIAVTFALKSRKILEEECHWMTNSYWKGFLLKVSDYLIHRKK